MTAPCCVHSVTSNESDNLIFFNEVYALHFVCHSLWKSVIWSCYLHTHWIEVIELQFGALWQNSFNSVKLDILSIIPIFFIFIHPHFSNKNKWTAILTKWNFKSVSFFLSQSLVSLTEYEPPPDPAPPEIPPRAQSLLASLTKKLSNYTLKTNETGDMKHEEFIPQHQQGKANESGFNLLKQHVDKWPQTSFN